MVHQMKHILAVIIAAAIPLASRAQQTINYSITVDSVVRQFILYVPNSYDGSSNVPLVISFHGLGGNAQAQMNDHDFRPIADTAGFIIAHPLGAPIINQTIRGWNFGDDSLPNDVLFTSRLIDTVSSDFAINPNQIYACGMSFGGFFSVFLAGQLSNRIASVASVAGTMLHNVPDSLFNPARPISFLSIHGTNDNNVPYTGSAVSKSAQDILDMFIEHNNCDTNATISALPNINTTDGSTVEHYLFGNGSNATRVEHLKIIGGRHTWPGENTNALGVNRDINGCAEIWKFFSQYDLNGFIGGVSTIEPLERISGPYTFPNPSKDFVTVELNHALVDATVINSSGYETCVPTISEGALVRFDIRNLPSGPYLLRLTSDHDITHLKFTKID